MRSDANHIALERTRGLLNLLRRSNFWTNGNEAESSIISKLKQLQQNLRINSSYAVDAVDVLAPFLAIVRAPYLAGPYKSAALESIHTFITCDILSECPGRTGEALAEVVDAVTHCKYVQTDAAGDELVQLLIVQVLQSVVKSPVRHYLTDETAWNIVESCHTIILQTGRTQKAALHQVIEQILLDSVRFIFACTPVNNKDVVSSAASSFGLPCAMKALGFFVNKLQKYAADVGESIKKNPSSGSRSPTPLGDSSLDSDIVELILSLKAIHAMLLAEGDMSKSRNVIMSCSPLATMVRDDLAKCLLMISSKRDFPPMVLQHVLALFGTLITSLGPAMRIMVECFFVHVYLKGLHQFYDILVDRENSYVVDDPNTRIVSIQNGFSQEELEIIMESLADLVLGRGFIQTLYATFDCDPTKPDIVAPLLGYLSKCTRVALLLDTTDLGSMNELSSLCVHTFLQIARLLAERCNNGDDAVDDSDEPQYNVGGASRDPALVNRAANASKYLVAVRKSKEVFAEASRLFTSKPTDGLKYLQSQGALPDKLTPESVAEFLRLAPGLPKENVGMYLGELGKEEKVCKFIGDGKEFHQNVLFCYVRSFTLTGQNVLSYLRIFLSAFRLPGEAQQIDRILVAFSENCFTHCMEKDAGIIDNAEVLYLLTFSIIMLNTDLHNPNIRPDRRMTIEQFVRNNTNYGSDVKQITPLSKDYLERIYRSLAEFPIKTERNDLSGSVTTEMWMDLQFQASLYPEKGVMITTCYSPVFLQALLACMRKKNNTDTNTSEGTAEKESIGTKGLIKDPVDSAFSSIRARSPLTVRIDEDTPSLSESYDLLEEMPYLIQPEESITKRVMYDTLNETNRKLDPLAMSAYIFGADWILDTELFHCIWRQLLEVGICPFLSHRASSKFHNNDQQHGKISKVPGPTSLWRAIDFLVVLLKLAHCNSYHVVVDSIIMILADFSGSLKNSVSKSVVGLLNLDSKLQSLVKIPKGPSRADDKFISTLIMSVSARAALCTLLQVVHNNPTYISRSWPAVWLTLSQMRDCSLLPMEMVQEADSDLLPARARLDFELRLLQLKNKSEGQQNPSPSTKVKKNKSLLSFGDFFFGSSPVEDDDDATRPPQYVERSIVSRWDSGYEDLEDPDGGTLETNVEGEAPMKTAMKNLRDLVEKCGISQLVSDTRFMSEPILQDFTTSLVNMTEMNSEDCLNDPTQDQTSESFEAKDEIDPSVAELNRFVASVASNMPQPSESSRCWLEMILVETSLRNRDRFSLLWPIISKHYEKTLGNVNSIGTVTTGAATEATTRTVDTVVKFDYSTERRVVGLFKIATRMLARKKVSSSLLELLGNLFTSPMDGKDEKMDRSNDAVKHPQSLPKELLVEMSGQIAAGMFRLLTLNVSVLPVLTLEQWQTLFDVISVTASAGGFASIKSFESMAWLLHEPRLRAEVPVFCVVAIKPLLRNTNAPMSVSVGAVQLLSHLHTRLEVLVKDETEEESEMGYDNSDTPVLWESCWAPILRALAEGIADGRHAVRVAAVDALSMAILDRHVVAVPGAVMIKILQDIVIPTALLLGEILLATPTGKSISDSAQGEQVLQEVLRGDSEVRRSKSAGSSVPGKENEKEAELEKNDSFEKDEGTVLPEGVLNRALSNVTPTRDLEVGPAIECLSALCQVFLQQLKKLSSQPSFDSLWSSLLDLFSFFLLPSDLGGKFDKSVIGSSSECAGTQTKCHEYLKDILIAFTSEGLFGDKYRSRWVHTYQICTKLNHGSKLLMETFSDCRAEATPALRTE